MDHQQLLHLAKNGLKVCLIDKGSICRGASGVNAGTLTMHMTRAKLIPYAKKGWELWMNTEKWLSNEIDVKQKKWSYALHLLKRKKNF